LGAVEPDADADAVGAGGVVVQAVSTMETATAPAATTNGILFTPTPHPTSFAARAALVRKILKRPYPKTVFPVKLSLQTSSPGDPSAPAQNREGARALIVLGGRDNL
jgi:hypothetical protein